MRKSYKNNLERGFINWIRKFNIDDNEVNEVIACIKKNMQEKSSLWDESKVREIILEWKEEQIKKKEEELNKRQKEIEDEVKKDVKTKKYEDEGITNKITKMSNIKEKDEDIENKDRLKQLKDKILSYEGDLRNVLIAIIENHPELVSIIDRHLQ
ncbi:hypothetical protein [Methanotorris formicicus]|uniref:hypothetical protein n=1 Tax=Methanotorris formicicus TaxID=213185 RepID=UPI0011452683|nr:hypothetical protein [Methanotorris formicicus]